MNGRLIKKIFNLDLDYLDIRFGCVICINGNVLTKINFRNIKRLENTKFNDMKLFFILILIIIALNLITNDTSDTAQSTKDLVKIISLTIFIYGFFLLLYHWNEMQWLY